MRLKLTDLAIRKLRHPERGQARYWDTSTPSFGVLVSQRSKSYMVMYGRDRRVKNLGRYPEKSLADARREAKRFLAMPVVSNRSKTHPEATEAFLDECAAKNRPKTVSGYRHFLTKLEFGGPVDQITRAHLRQFLSDPHALTAFKVYLNWCVRNNLIDRNPVVGDRVQYASSRTRVLSPKELKLIWQYDHPPFSDILKLCILTGQRRSEIAATTSDWIDGDVLHIPAHITKNKRPHSLPITGRSKQYLPVGGFNGWSKAKVRIDKHIPLQHWTIHDLRRTFSTIHAEIGTPLHVTEKLLNHVSGTVSGVAAIYNRHTYMIEMRDALEAYDAHIATILVI